MRDCSRFGANINLVSIERMKLQFRTEAVHGDRSFLNIAIVGKADVQRGSRLSRSKLELEPGTGHNTWLAVKRLECDSLETAPQDS